MQQIVALDNGMATYFGQGHADLDIVQATPMLSLTPMSSMDHEDDYAALRQRMRPYVAFAMAAPAAAASLDGKALAEALATKEDHQEVKHLHHAKVCNAGVFMAGKVNVATGIITTLALAEISKTHRDSLEIKTKDKRAETFGCHLNTKNKLRGTSPWDQHCSMSHTDPVLMSALASARWPQVVITDLSKDLLVSSMPAFCKY